MTVILDRTASDFSEENDYHKCPSCNRNVYGYGVRGMCPSCGAPVETDDE